MLALRWFFLISLIPVVSLDLYTFSKYSKNKANSVSLNFI